MGRLVRTLAILMVLGYAWKFYRDVTSGEADAATLWSDLKWLGGMTFVALVLWAARPVRCAGCGKVITGDVRRMGNRWYCPPCALGVVAGDVVGGFLRMTGFGRR